MTPVSRDERDALTSPRPYKEAWSLERAAEHLREGRGVQFDPRCIDAFFEAWGDVVAIRRAYPD